MFGVLLCPKVFQTNPGEANIDDSENYADVSATLTEVQMTYTPPAKVICESSADDHGASANLTSRRPIASV
jgi:hypothetical protein